MQLANATFENREAFRSLASVPGMSEERARELAAKGFRDFADVVRLALPEKRGPTGIAPDDRSESPAGRPRATAAARSERARCPVCAAAWLADATRCASCGSTVGLELDPVAIEQRLEEITGDLVNLAEDEDFQGMPEEIRNEILQAFGGVTRDDLSREEYVHQIEAWRTKGFDVAHVEHLLEEDLPNFRERSARLICLQVAKKVDSGRYRCPLCEVRLESTAEQCANCGARFS